MLLRQNVAKELLVVGSRDDGLWQSKSKQNEINLRLESGVHGVREGRSEWEGGGGVM